MTVTQLRVGDAPADQVFSFEVTIANPISLIPVGGGAPSTIAVNMNRLELSRTAGKMQPLAVMPLKPGSYAAADISIQSPSLTYAKTLLTPAPVTLIDRVNGADQTVRINFNPPLVVGNDPVVLNLDINLAAALVSDGAGNISGTNFTQSSFNFSVQPVGIQGRQQDDDGEFEDETGKIVEVSTSGFVLQTGQSGSRLPFTVDGTTTLPNGLHLPDLQNRIVQLEGFTRSDGMLFGQQVEALGGQNAAQVEGTITTVGSFNIPSLLEFTVQDGTGTGFSSTQIGQDFLVDISSLPTAAFATDYGDCDMSELASPTINFPFDSTHLKAGQRIEIITESGVNATQPIVPVQARLQQQAISGIVAGFVALPGGASSFDLLLPADSYLTLLSGQTSVHVFTQPKTDNRVDSLANGSAIRVRGPLFWTGTQFNMVARRITQ
ncbi:MAG TPA: hypothetical protein VKV30_05790 [Candidatus Angelobacter sp.]|nr:hypothetical protein [Candidatus Angelobacter sp.]